MIIPDLGLSHFSPLLKTGSSGFFLVFEGLDGCGKTTQATLLAQHLQDHKPYPGEVCVLKEPTSESPEGKTIRGFSSDHRPTPEEELKLFLKDREWDLTRNILPTLNKGGTVVMDRYIISNICYQGALGLPLPSILGANLEFPWPDLTIILDIDPHLALLRIEGRKEEPKNEIFSDFGIPQEG
jgi:dTMP kinase